MGVANMFTAEWFYALDKKLRELGMDSDAQTFDEIRENLSHRHVCTPDEFADSCTYVILAGGFSQKTAKKIYAQIISVLHTRGADFDYLFSLFHNKNKIAAICKIWETRGALCAEYYRLDTIDARLKFLENLPHIGKITAHHLARNLGEDIVKYDIWIQRLGVLYGGNTALYAVVDNGKLNDDIKSACDKMFADMCEKTGLPRGYVDVVLWKASQVGLIEELKHGCKN